MIRRSTATTSAQATRDRIYPLAGLVTVIAVIVALSVVLSELTERHVYELLTDEGTHLAASIKASALHGLSRVTTSQVELVRRLQVQAVWLDSTLTGNSERDGPLIASMGEREDLDVVAVYDQSLRPVVWAGGPPPRPGRARRWEVMHPHGPPTTCPEVCGPLVGLMAQFYESGDEERTFDLWGWHHGWHRSWPRPVAYARRRTGGGVVFLRTSPDLVRRTLDVESFQGLLDNLALARKIHSIAVTDGEGVVVFSTARDQLGLPWRDPHAAANLLVVNDPFPLGGDTNGTLRIALTTDEARAVLAGARRNLAILTAAASAIGMVGLLSVFAVERRHRIRVDGMRAAFDRQERLADLGRMAATVAHEIRNPLNALGLTAQRLEKRWGAGEGGDDVRGLAAMMRQEIGRLDRTVEAFLNLARPPSTVRHTVDLNAVCSGVVNLYRTEADSLGITLRYDPWPDPLAADADPDQMHQAVSNLVRNALESTPRGGAIVIGSRREGPDAVLWVHDRGPGFSPDALAHAADAFYSTKARGMGLGLTFADRVARDHGGGMRVANGDEGAVVELWIPPARKDEQ